MNRPHVLLLRGAPGVGKSTTATFLREAHGLAVVEVDDLRGELWHVPPLSGFSDAERHQVALAHAAVTALALIRAGRPVVIVDTFNSAGIAVLELALRGRAAILPIALVLEPGELTRRLATRPEVPGVFRNAEVSTRFNEELRDAPGTHVDAGHASPAEIAALVFTFLAQAEASPG